MKNTPEIDLAIRSYPFDLKPLKNTLFNRCRVNRWAKSLSGDFKQIKAGIMAGARPSKVIWSMTAEMSLDGSMLETLRRRKK